MVSVYSHYIKGVDTTASSYYPGYVGMGDLSILSPVNITYLYNKTYFVSKGTMNYTLMAIITDDNGNIIVTNSRYLFSDNATNIKYTNVEDFNLLILHYIKLEHLIRILYLKMQVFIKHI